MKAWTLTPLLAIVASGACTTASIAAEAVVCPKPPGFFPGPFVPDERTARSIFRDVEQAVFPEADRKGFPVIMVKDQGDHWTVWRTHGPIKQPADGRSFIIPHGGGQLSMLIDKCTGGVRDAALMR